MHHGCYCDDAKKLSPICRLAFQSETLSANLASNSTKTRKRVDTNSDSLTSLMRALVRKHPIAHTKSTARTDAEGPLHEGPAKFHGLTSIRSVLIRRHHLQTPATFPVYLPLLCLHLLYSCACQDQGSTRAFRLSQHVGGFRNAYYFQSKFAAWTSSCSS